MMPRHFGIPKRDAAEAVKVSLLVEGAVALAIFAMAVAVFG